MHLRPLRHAARHASTLLSAGLLLIAAAGCGSSPKPEAQTPPQQPAPAAPEPETATQPAARSSNQLQITDPNTGFSFTVDTSQYCVVRPTRTGACQGFEGQISNLEAMPPAAWAIALKENGLIIAQSAQVREPPDRKAMAAMLAGISNTASEKDPQTKFFIGRAQQPAPMHWLHTLRNKSAIGRAHIRYYVLMAPSVVITLSVVGPRSPQTVKHTAAIGRTIQWPGARDIETPIPVTSLSELGLAMPEQ